ncbi:uncharacterized protein CMU_037840 [Cryptosporidium muris RN66]|uniref:Uncharacterized protein n=1 Tax=Cryptosporidium muris (strain RN66) TaxID=441375 RepID=B6A928_CRYMR|nr:uncharacterized protein CMU_037840 [Cryptosporidium muris RN66]EEA04719.1 hypothetical protein, conserved [Cryptosporidium muris RN66]|eukprot:XP_002139068.1 hypothetical protein [Cryptosporidium muris RN66]
MTLNFILRYPILYTSAFLSLSRCIIHTLTPIPKYLKDIAKIPLLEREDSTCIKAIWKERFQYSRNIIVDTINSETYTNIYLAAKVNPMFIIPPSEKHNSFHWMIFQCQEYPLKHILITYIKEFNNGNFTPFIIFNWFNELQKSKSLVLLKLDIIHPGISKLQGSFIFNYILRCYQDPKIFQFVKIFNQSPREFNINQFVEVSRNELNVWNISNKF